MGSIILSENLKYLDKTIVIGKLLKKQNYILNIHNEHPHHWIDLYHRSVNEQRGIIFKHIVYREIGSVWLLSEPRKADILKKVIYIESLKGGEELITKLADILGENTECIIIKDYENISSCSYFNPEKNEFFIEGDM